MKYKFKAKDLKSNQWVVGDLIYANRMFESSGVRPMIVSTYIHGGMLWIGNRYFVDEDTIELIKEE